LCSDHGAAPDTMLASIMRVLPQPDKLHRRLG
jgi:hypothetical protein